MAKKIKIFNNCNGGSQRRCVDAAIASAITKLYSVASLKEKQRTPLKTFLQTLNLLLAVFGKSLKVCRSDWLNFACNTQR